MGCSSSAPEKESNVIGQPNQTPYRVPLRASVRKAKPQKETKGSNTETIETPSSAPSNNVDVVSNRNSKPRVGRPTPAIDRSKYFQSVLTVDVEVERYKLFWNHYTFQC